MRVIEPHGSEGATRAPDPADAPPGPLTDLLTLARPLHAAKTLLLVPLAVVDAGRWTFTALGEAAWAAAGFVLAGAVVYVGNDIADRHRDRHHPVKRHRPVAAGRVSVRAACLYGTVLLALLGAVVAAAPGRPFWPLLAYLALNAAYSRALKHIPLVDVTAVALGFALRLVHGYLAVGARMSGWLVLTVFSASLLLVVGKRRQELLTAGIAHRPALRGYSVELADQLLQLTCVLTAVSGLLYLRTEAPFGPYGEVVTLFAAPLTLFALFRYLQVVLVDGGGGDPVRWVLRDRRIAGAGVALALLLGTALLLARHPAAALGILP
ncbi:UbiA prenyltransferase family protein [Sphaerisporangium fuscum]|uniref:UbiA prenyltransferase family protein n=1 Tax=Sphaerisporangium fuscum TaxID=2835868 RepID=UPI001BDD802F|nr:UbiA prenyltransferase family protein [Sphaerisporangium fuscum]